MNNQIITVNEKEILIINEDGEKFVAIKPICEAIGVSVQKQMERLKNDPILGSVITLRVTTGADDKQYNMQTIPFRYVFGWLFKIDPRNVKEEVQESVIKYQKECYDALFDAFTKRTSILKEKSKRDLRIEELERTWKETPEYKEIQELKIQNTNDTKILNAMDKSFVNEQYSLFKKDGEEPS